MKTKIIYTLADLQGMRKDNKVRMFFSSLISKSEGNAYWREWGGRQAMAEEVAKINAAGFHDLIDSHTCNRYNFALRTAGNPVTAHYIVITPKASLLPDWMLLGTKFVLPYTRKITAFQAYSDLMSAAEDTDMGKL